MLEPLGQGTEKLWFFLGLGSFLKGTRGLCHMTCSLGPQPLLLHFNLSRSSPDTKILSMGDRWLLR